MLTMTPYPGFKGEYFSMPCRNVVPKPLQKPHPPLWLACSNSETIKKAARNGMGALVFSFVSPAEAKHWVDEYYRTLREECVPIGQAVNANIAVFNGFGMHEDNDEALRRWVDPFRFIGYGLGHHYVFGRHTPGRSHIASDFDEARATGKLKTMPDTTAIGSPEKVRAAVRAFADVGADQMSFNMPFAPLDDLLHSIELFASEIMPEYKEKAEEREYNKWRELAPFIEQAFARKQVRSELADQDIPVVAAIGRKIMEESPNPVELATIFPKDRLAAIAAPLYDPLGRS
jgi:alkanesulfonate monooxygenase SsuD/methylene tetrahydromethanopterin reductase-like flavin-dependent oxidoreductase (luciferase family)